MGGPLPRAIQCDDDRNGSAPRDWAQPVQQYKARLCVVSIPQPCANADDAVLAMLKRTLAQVDSWPFEMGGDLLGIMLLILICEEFCGGLVAFRRECSLGPWL